jgi:hypothetical protein
MPLMDQELLSIPEHLTVHLRFLGEFVLLNL